MKDQWYKTTEAILYEYKTLDSAIMHLKRRGDAEKLHAKEQLKKDLDAIILKLPKHEQDFIEHVYGEADTTVDSLCALFGKSTATFYRDKRNIVKKIASYLGYV